MKINRLELVSKLATVMPAVGFNAMLPEFQRIRLHGTQIAATDGAMQIVTSLNTDLGCSCSVMAREFFDLLNSLTDVDVEITEQENHLLIKAGRVKSKFATFPYKPLKDIEAVGDPVSVGSMGEGWTKSLMEKLSFCQISASKDETAGMWCGVILEKECIIASDKYRISRTRWANPLPCNEPISIPLGFIDLLSKYQDQLDLIGLGNQGKGTRLKVYAMLVDGTLLATTLYEGQYENLNKFFPEPDAESQVIPISPEIITAIERHSLFLKNVKSVDREITIELNGGRCTISSEVKEVAALSETFDLAVDPTWNFTTYANPTYFDVNVSQGHADEKVLRLFTDRGFILFVCGEHEYLINTRG